MIFIRTNDRFSSKVKARHQERIGHFCGLLAFMVLILVGVMLYMAITTQFSEQKTVYYIVFALGIVAFGILTGITIHSVYKSTEKLESERVYNANQLASKRMAMAYSQNLDEQFHNDIQLQIQNSLTDYNLRH